MTIVKVEKKKFRVELERKSEQINNWELRIWYLRRMKTLDVP
jgi:hypothetical protein